MYPSHDVTFINRQPNTNALRELVYWKVVQDISGSLEASNHALEDASMSTNELILRNAQVLIYA